MTKDRIHQLLESKDPDDRAARFTQQLILGLIVISTAAVIIETLPELADSSAVFYAIEVVTVICFTIEYVLRVWSCTAEGRYPDSFGGRLKFVRSPMALIDLIAILPFYLAFLPLDLRFLRLLRILRILRLAKLFRYSEALHRLGRVVMQNRYELGVTLFLGFIMLIMSSCLVYFAEYDAQPDRFSSIPATMWWAVATLTTVGYGDLTPITPLGRFAGALVAITGIGMVALPTGILGAAFVEALKEDQQRAEHVCPHCGK